MQPWEVACSETIVDMRPSWMTIRIADSSLKSAGDSERPRNETRAKLKLGFLFLQGRISLLENIIRLVRVEHERHHRGM